IIAGIGRYLTHIVSIAGAAQCRASSSAVKRILGLKYANAAVSVKENAVAVQRHMPVFQFLREGIDKIFDQSHGSIGDIIGHASDTSMRNSKPVARKFVKDIMQFFTFT